MPTELGAPLIEASALSKVFPGTVAVDGVDLELRPGQVLAVVGANGSGKTTLLSMLCGLRRPTRGRVAVAGDPVEFSGPTDALARGIAYVPQEPQLAPTLTAWENLLLADLGRIGRMRPGRRERAGARRLASEVLGGRSPDTRVSDLRKADRAMLSMFAALRHRPRVLALDEPTAVLGAQGAEIVNEAIAGVISRRGAVLLVSHRLRDIVQLATHVLVLVDGRKVHDAAVETSTVTTLIDSLASGRDAPAADPDPEPEPASGRDAPATGPDPEPASGRATLVMEGVTTADGLEIPRLSVGEGEIVGIAGLAGSGRSRLCRVLAGSAPRSGSVTYTGGPHRPNPVAMRRRGIAYLPEDRAREGMFPVLSVERNLEVSEVAATALMRRWPRTPDRHRWAALADEFGIKRASESAGITSLSGGNQQRCVLARTLARGPRLLVADEPTQGVDRSGRRAIHRHIRQYAAAGGSAVIVSSEFDELQELCDRIIVLLDGRPVAEVPPTAEYRDLMAYATLGEPAGPVAAAGGASPGTSATGTPAPPRESPPRESPPDGGPR